MYVYIYIYTYTRKREPSKCTFCFLIQVFFEITRFSQSLQKNLVFLNPAISAILQIVPNVCSTVQNYDAFSFALPIPVLPAMLHLFLAFSRSRILLQPNVGARPPKCAPAHEQ